MFKIAICDDESFFTEELRELLSSYMMEKDVVFEIDTYSSGEALIELGIEVVRYNIVFLDINMEKVDGIKTAEMIRKVSREVFICNRLCGLFAGGIPIRCCKVFVKGQC